MLILLEKIVEPVAILAQALALGNAPAACPGALSGKPPLQEQVFDAELMLRLPPPLRKQGFDADPAPAAWPSTRASRLLA